MRLHQPDIVLLPLTRSGRLADPEAYDRLQDALPHASHCFLFCPGWLTDAAEARQGAARLFGHLDTALCPLSDRIQPLRAAVHWPSRPFAAPPEPPRDEPHPLVLEPLLAVAELVRSRPGLVDRLLVPLLEAEVPLGPEEELELDALLSLAPDGGRGGGMPSVIRALSFWLMKRRAGQVGERLGRELLRPALAGLGARAPRLHLIGHSFGANLLTAAVMSGLRPESLVLLQGALSAFALADEVPGTRRPGRYRPVVAEQMVAGSIVAVRSAHDRALGNLYPVVTWGTPVDRAVHDQGRRRTRDVVVRSAMGAVGARATGAPDLELLTAVTTGLPPGPVVNVDASRVITRPAWLIGAHGDIHHEAIATLILLAAGLLTGSPSGARPRRTSPLNVS